MATDQHDGLTREARTPSGKMVKFRVPARLEITALMGQTGLEFEGMMQHYPKLVNLCLDHLIEYDGKTEWTRDDLHALNLGDFCGIVAKIYSAHFEGGGTAPN